MKALSSRPETKNHMLNGSLGHSGHTKSMNTAGWAASLLAVELSAAAAAASTALVAMQQTTLTAALGAASFGVPQPRPRRTWPRAPPTRRRAAELNVRRQRLKTLGS